MTEDPASARETIGVCARRGVGTALETFQYALLVVFLGVVTTVAAGNVPADAGGGPVLVHLIDVPFISRALAVGLDGQDLVTVMLLAIVTFIAYTGLFLPILHYASIPVTASQESVLTLPDLSVFGVPIDPFLTAVPALVIIALTAIPASNHEGPMPSVDIVRTGVVTGVAYAVMTLVVAVLAREVLVAFLTAIAGPAATTGVTVHLLTPGTVGIVVVYASVGATIGATIGVRSRDLDVPF